VPFGKLLSLCIYHAFLLLVVTTLAACMSVTAAQCKPSLKGCDTNDDCCSHHCAPVKVSMNSLLCIQYSTLLLTPCTLQYQWRGGLKICQ
ncbi:hypothetical protein DFJ58DRAFT_786429, partial [Suillus subalutaceus]|uniref:uncharacterized protein n=1 Tax=Suillus subalutaceus TaxID=48586 RepID=UPI001B87C5F7